MNVHDSERLSGLLKSAGYVDIASVPGPPETADAVVFNTCAIQENAATVRTEQGVLGRLTGATSASMCFLPRWRQTRRTTHLRTVYRHQPDLDHPGLAR